MTPALKTKTRRAFFFVILALLLLALAVAVQLNAYEESVSWVKHTGLVLSTIDSVLLSITRLESAQRGYMLTAEERFLDAFVQARGDCDRSLRELHDLTRDNPGQQSNVDRLRRQVEEREQTLDLYFQKRRVAQASEALHDVLTKNMTRIQAILTTTRAMREVEKNLLQNRTRTERDMKVAVGISFAVCIAVSFALLAWTYGVIKQYDQARELAAEQILQLNADLEQRVAERTMELEIANTRLLRSNEDLTKFAYVASHDLQEPLRTIGSYIGLLGFRYQGRLDDQADKYIRFVVDGAKRMQSLVQDLLIYSRVGTDALRFRKVNVGNLMRNVQESLGLLITEQQAEIHYGDLPVVIADESKLTQVFMNLIANGMKFRKPEENPRIRLSAERRHDEWVFSISDNGIGFDQQYAERIFVVFQRLHGVGAYSGTGIGLAICKRVIEQHSGKIWAVSTPGEGSTFSFTVPVNLRPTAEESFAGMGE